LEKKIQEELRNQGIQSEKDLAKSEFDSLSGHIDPVQL
jgi:hypothetical protein